MGCGFPFGFHSSGGREDAENARHAQAVRGKSPPHPSRCRGGLPLPVAGKGRGEGAKFVPIEVRFGAKGVFKRRRSRPPSTASSTKSTTIQNPSSGPPTQIKSCCGKTRAARLDSIHQHTKASTPVLLLERSGKQMSGSFRSRCGTGLRRLNTRTKVPGSPKGD
jgi:hypothetical protein